MTFVFSCSRPKKNDNFRAHFQESTEMHSRSIVRFSRYTAPRGLVFTRVRAQEHATTAANVQCINVASFIKDNITPFHDRPTFLAKPTPRTTRLLKQIDDLKVIESLYSSNEIGQLPNIYQLVTMENTKVKYAMSQSLRFSFRKPLVLING